MHERCANNVGVAWSRMDVLQAHSHSHSLSLSAPKYNLDTDLRNPTFNTDCYNSNFWAVMTAEVAWSGDTNQNGSGPASYQGH